MTSSGELKQGLGSILLKAWGWELRVVGADPRVPECNGDLRVLEEGKKVSV